MPRTQTEINERFYQALFLNDGADFAAPGMVMWSNVAQRPAVVEERSADEQFTNWVLGYGYAAGHVPPVNRQRSVRARQLRAVAA
jgi:hypothetical protein